MTIRGKSKPKKVTFDKNIKTHYATKTFGRTSLLTTLDL
jgi:hypothetical protein